MNEVMKNELAENEKQGRKKGEKGKVNANTDQDSSVNDLQEDSNGATTAEEAAEELVASLNGNSHTTSFDGNELQNNMEMDTAVESTQTENIAQDTDEAAAEISSQVPDRTNDISAETL